MMDALLTRVDGAIDLAVGRRANGWAKLDVSADGFWNSFLAIPACLPALLVTWLAHGTLLAGEGSRISPAALVLSLALIELLIWLLTIGLVLVAAKPLGWAERAVPAIIALNWASVPIAYARAVPATLIILLGLGEGTAFMMLVFEVLILVAYWRVLSAALERNVPMVAAVFVGTIAFGYALADWGHRTFDLLPTAA